MHPLIETITTADPRLRNRSLESHCGAASDAELLDACAALEDFRHSCANLYQRVRALFFLYAIHRYYLPAKFGGQQGHIPFAAYNHLLKRRFE